MPSLSSTWRVYQPLRRAGLNFLRLPVFSTGFGAVEVRVTLRRRCEVTRLCYPAEDAEFIILTISTAPSWTASPSKSSYSSSVALDASSSSRDPPLPLRSSSATISQTNSLDFGPVGICILTLRKEVFSIIRRLLFWHTLIQS